MIESIYIKNFKSIKKSRANLPFFGAIVGNNAAGKTNLIQAIAFIKESVFGKDINLVQKKLSFIAPELFNLAEKVRDFSLNIILKDTENKRYSLETVIRLKENEPNMPKLIVGGEKLAIVDEKGKDIQLIYTRDQINKLKDEKNQDIPLAVDAGKLAVSLYRHPVALAAKRLFSNIFIPGSTLINFRQLTSNPDEEGLATLLVHLKRKTPERFEQFQTIIKKMLPAFSSIVELPALSPIIDNNIRNKAHDSSNGEQRFIVLLEEKNLSEALSMSLISGGDFRTLFFIAKAISIEDNSSLIIEEIENGMHPKRVRELIDRLSTISHHKDLQILFTTHSPGVINYLRPSEVLYVKKDIKEGTKFILLEESEQIVSISNVLKKGGDLTDYIDTRLK